LPAAGQEVRAEGLVIGAGEVGGEDAAGRGHVSQGISRGVAGISKEGSTGGEAHL
jgi:hypothetical protein